MNVNIDVFRRMSLAILAAALTATAAGAATYHRFSVSQTTGSEGAQAYVQSSASGSALQAEVTSSTPNTRVKLPFGLLGEYDAPGSTFGIGVAGISTTGYGVAGESLGASPSVIGVSGGNETAIEGTNPDASSTAAPTADFIANGGTAIQALSQGGAGLALSASATAAGGDGVIINGGTTSGQCADYIGDGIGVCAEGQNVGASFVGDGPMGVGVGGESPICNGSSASTCAPIGLATPLSNDGGTPAEAGAGVGGVGVSGPGIFGYSYFDYGMYAQNSSTLATLEVENAAGTGTDPAIEVNDDATNKKTLVEANGNFYTDGSVVSGTNTFTGVSANPKTDVMTYSTQQAEATVEDVGTARLVNGSAAVPLAADFRQTINAAAPYMVIVTPYGESRGLYVASRTPAGFVVRENAGGRSTLQFDYRIVAQPYGSAPTRLPHLHDMIAFPHTPVHHTDTAHTRLLNRIVPFGAKSASVRRLYQAPPVPPNMLNLSALRSH